MGENLKVGDRAQRRRRGEEKGEETKSLTAVSTYREIKPFPKHWGGRESETLGGEKSKEKGSQGDMFAGVKVKGDVYEKMPFRESKGQKLKGKEKIRPKSGSPSQSNKASKA